MYNCYFDETYKPMRNMSTSSQTPHAPQTDTMDAFDDIDFQSHPSDAGNMHTKIAPFLQSITTHLQSDQIGTDNITLLAVALYLFSNEGQVDWDSVSLLTLLMCLGM